jgi:hypothetical protein
VLKQGPGTELCLSKLIILLLNAVGEGSWRTLARDVRSGRFQVRIQPTIAGFEGGVKKAGTLRCWAGSSLEPPGEASLSPILTLVPTDPFQTPHFQKCEMSLWKFLTEEIEN